MYSNSLGCSKIFPLSAPVLYWLSHLTCISSLKAKTERKTLIYTQLKKTSRYNRHLETHLRPIYFWLTCECEYVCVIVCVCVLDTGRLLHFAAATEDIVQAEIRRYADKTRGRRTRVSASACRTWGFGWPTRQTLWVEVGSTVSALSLSSPAPTLTGSSPSTPTAPKRSARSD